VAVHQLDIIEIILGFLPPIEIMLLRRVCVVWKEAARNTIVPTSDYFYFRVDSLNRYNAMRVMTRAMPNLQQITIDHLGEDWHRWSDGEDPDEEYAHRTADYTTHDIEIISNFSKLRVLEIDNVLNGRYPFLFNSFPLLQKLSVCSYYLKWDLNMLAGFPVLKELECQHQPRLTGNISSLRALKNTLVKITIDGCDHVEGSIMDLADFPHLKELNLDHTAVTGDIRDIGENDFSLLEELTLPMTVYGGRGSKLQRIADAPDLMRAIYLLKKQRPALFGIDNWYWILSRRSPDWYESVDEDYPTPFFINFVKAGSRTGYRWLSHFGNPCEVNWLDPEPDRESSDYEEYIQRLREMNWVLTTYRGFHQPPTEEEYNRLIDG
jgi:hypothetical protein